MSKIIKPLLNEDGTQVKRKLVKGDWYYSFALDNFSQWYQDGSAFEYLIYHEEKWKPKEHEMYYFFNVMLGHVYSSRYEQRYTSDKLNYAIGNCFRTLEEAEQADIQQILDNLKEYYKNKQQEGK